MATLLFLCYLLSSGDAFSPPNAVVVVTRREYGCAANTSIFARDLYWQRQQPQPRCYRLHQKQSLSQTTRTTIRTTTTTTLHLVAAVAAAMDDIPFFLDTVGTNLENWWFGILNLANGLTASSLDQGGSIPILYSAGLLTSFSPCVWGLLPVTMSYISQATKEREDQQAIYPTMAFALGLTVVFCTLGVAATQVGGAVMGGSDNPTVGILSNAICLIMGLKILELIEIPLPSWNGFRDAVSGMSGGGTLFSNKQQQQQQQPILIDATGQILSSTSTTTMSKTKADERASLFRTFLLGGSSALAASPCATPVLTSILAFVANSASDANTSTAAYGAVLLLAYSMGYATPLLLVAGTGGQALAKLRSSGYDKVGPWVTPITGAILLWYGTTGLLTSVLGDPSLFGLPVLE